MYRYLIIIEKGEHNYSAYVPDLPGCITTGATYEEVQRNMCEAITLHLRGMVEDQEPILTFLARIGKTCYNNASATLL